MTRAATRLLFLVLCLTAASCRVSCKPGITIHGGVELEGHAKREISLPVSVASGETVFLSATFGDIRVRSAEKDEPMVTARLAMSARTDEEASKAIEGYRLQADREPRGLVVRLVGEPLRIETEGGGVITQAPTMEIEAVLPPGTSLDLDSSSGDITVTGPFGPVRAQTSFGDVEVTDVRGADIATSSGDVVVEELREGSLEIEASFGGIEAAGVLTAVDVSTSSGDVQVEAEAGSRVAAPWKLESSFGDVELEVPAGLSFRLRAETSFGKIRSEIPIKVETSLSGGRCEAKVGDGGQTVTLKTSSGDIRIARR
ncbi:MAG: DUF4097 family beta strand repeat-containing protein [Planctomycetota bacterium]|jgi:hypothetical protein